MAATTDAGRALIASFSNQVRLMKMMANMAAAGELTHEQTARATGESRTNILWTVGHLAQTTDAMLRKYLGGDALLTEDYAVKYGMGTTPAANAADYPPLAELLASFNRVCDGAMELIESLGEDDLARPLPAESFLATFLKNIEEFIPFAVMHAMYHVGQIGLLRRAQGLKPLMG